MITEENIPPLHSVKPTVRLHVNSPYTFYGEPTASPLTSDMRAQMAATEFEETWYYINNSFRDVTIMKRDGLTFTLPPTASAFSRDFTIRRVLKLRAKALSTAIAAIAQLPDVDSAELHEIKRCLSNVDNGKYAEASIMLDYVITVEDLKNKGNTLYHYQSDLVVSFKDILTVDAHPYSTNFLNVGTFGVTNEYSQQKELNLKIRLVDHSPTASAKYISVAGKVFKLYPQKDAPHRTIVAHAPGKRVEKNYADYVQVFFSAANDAGASNQQGVGAIRMSAQEAKSSMGLCDSLSDAINPSRIEAERKKELADSLHALELLRGENQRDRTLSEREEMIRKADLTAQQHELELSKMAALKKKQEIEAAQHALNMEVADQKQKQSKFDADLQRLDNDRRTLEMQRRNQDEVLNRERQEFEEKSKRVREDQEARIKNEALHWKEFYEMRSLQRKDASDLMKFIPGVLMGIAGIAAAWLKFSSPAKAG